MPQEPKQKKSGRSISGDPKYPTEWSLWGWNSQYLCQYRYRLKGSGDYEYEYEESQDSSPAVEVPVAQDTIIETHQAQQLASDYSTDYVGVMTQNFRRTTLESVTHTHPQVYSLPSRHVRPKPSGTVREERDPNYKAQESEEFQFGRVFKILWSENKVDEPKYLCADSNYSKFYTLGNCTKTTRFVIVGVDRGAYICLPIRTYGKQGTLHSGVYPDDHAVIYTEGLPKAFEDERLTKKSIRVSPVSSREKLDAASRLNYAQVYKIECNVKLVFIGAVHSSSRGQLWKDFIAVNPGGWNTSAESSSYSSGSSHAVRQRAENYNDDDGEDSSYLQIHEPKMGQPYKEWSSENGPGLREYY